MLLHHTRGNCRYSPELYCLEPEPDGYFGYETNDLTINDFVDYGNPNINDNTSRGMFFDDYNQTGLVITNANIQGETEGIYAPEQATGETLIENSYFQNVDNVVDSPQVPSMGLGLPDRILVLLNDTFAAPRVFPLLSIDMDYDTRVSDQRACQSHHA